MGASYTWGRLVHGKIRYLPLALCHEDGHSQFIQLLCDLFSFKGPVVSLVAGCFASDIKIFLKKMAGLDDIWNTDLTIFGGKRENVLSCFISTGVSTPGEVNLQ